MKCLERKISQCILPLRGLLSKVKTTIFGTKHFTEIHRSLLRKIERILNGPATEFCNGGDVDAGVVEPRRAVAGPISFLGGV